MDLIIKHFDELNTNELLNILKLRVSVFVVEQNCPYMEIDDFDKLSYHLWLKDKDEIIAYGRVLPPHTSFSDPSIGRIISTKKRQGYGTKIVKAAIDVAKDKFKAENITIEAQVYAKTLYEKIGFKQTSDEFLEDNIPHIKMRLEI